MLAGQGKIWYSRICLLKNCVCSGGFAMSALFTLSVCLLSGLLLSRLAKKLGLPAVTAYLIAGLLLGPFCIGSLGLEGLGFTSLEQVSAYNVISQTALGFIAFAIGNEFRLQQLRQMGRAAIVIGILQAVLTTALVDAVLLTIHFWKPH